MANDEEGITLGRYYDEATQHVGAKIPTPASAICFCSARTEPARARAF